jgi:hypothetical protein
MSGFWDEVIEMSDRTTQDGDNGGSKLRSNVAQYLPYYTMQHPRREQSSSSTVTLSERNGKRNKINGKCVQHDRMEFDEPKEE